MRGDVVLQSWRDLIGEAFVNRAGDPGEGRRESEDQKSRERVVKGSTKDRRELEAKEIRDDRKARRFAAIDRPVRPPDQMIQVVDQALIANLFAGDGQVSRRAPVEPAELAHLFAAQVIEAKARRPRRQLFEPLPFFEPRLEKIFEHRRVDYHAAGRTATIALCLFRHSSATNASSACSSTASPKSASVRA